MCSPTRALKSSEMCIRDRYKTGSRNESVVFSMQTFVVKLASAVSVLIAGIGIDLIGLDDTAAVQSESTLLGLQNAYNTSRAQTEQQRAGAVEQLNLARQGCSCFRTRGRTPVPSMPPKMAAA